MFVCLNYDPIQPTFGKVFDIAVIDQAVIVSVCEYVGLCFCAHYGGLIIKSKASIRAVDMQISLIIDHHMQDPALIKMTKNYI